MIRRNQLTALSLALVAGTALAAGDKPARLLPAGAIDVAALLPDPPALGSAEARAEVDAVLAVQQSRTPADVAEAKATEKFDVFAFADAVGPAWFNADQCPKTAALFAQLGVDGKALAKVGKDHWASHRTWTTGSSPW